MTCAFNVNPPKPKYIFIWDVEKVLSYLNNLNNKKFCLIP